MAYNPPLFAILWAEQDGRCWYCDVPMLMAPHDKRNGVGAPKRLATKEHLISKKRLNGTPSPPGNVKLACRACNLKKGHRTEAEFRHEESAWLATRTAAMKARFG